MGIHSTEKTYTGRGDYAHAHTVLMRGTIGVGTRVVQGNSRVIKGCFKNVSRMFQVCVRGFHWCFLEVSRVFPECFKGVSRKFQVFQRRKFQMYQINFILNGTHRRRKACSLIAGKSFEKT